jgi:hypothetical protein
MDARLKEMEQAEADLSVLSLNPPGVQIYDDTKKAVSLVQDMNDRLAEIVQSRSGRFGGLGSLAPQDPKRSADEVKRIMGPLGLAGVLIALSPTAVSGSVGSVLPISLLLRPCSSPLKMDFRKKLSGRTDSEDNLAFIANHTPTLPQRGEGSSQLLNEQVGLFKGSKVTTPIKLIPVDQV